MPDTAAALSPRQIWLRHLARIGADHGVFERIGRRHLALFVEEGETLVISFDRAERLWDQGERGLPLGFDAVSAHEYSLLSLISIGRTWFRDAAVDQMLDELAKDCVFASYRQVVILASGPDCSHAAARAARLVPDARVLLSRPAAAISARHAPFERRFLSDRRMDPDTPPPLGPEALQAAAHTIVLFDPTNPFEAAQAALFRAEPINRVALPHAGPSLDRVLRRSEVQAPLTRALASGDIGPDRLRALLRPALRRDAGYLARIGAAPRD